MSLYPMFQMDQPSVKVRFNEPAASESLNLKHSGVVPPGIYRGFDIPGLTHPVGVPFARYLYINTDPVSKDSVAVAEIGSHHSLTIRTDQQIVLDFLGHTAPVYVVIRANYSFTPVPFGGITDAKIMVIDTAAVLPTDIKLCRVIWAAGTFRADDLPGNRDDLGGPLVAQSQLGIREITTYEDITSGTLSVADDGLFHSFGVPAVIPFVQAQDGIVLFLASCTVQPNPVPNCMLGIRLDGPTGTGPLGTELPFAATIGAPVNMGGVSGGVAFSSLVRGPHTAELVLRGNGGGAAPSILINSGPLVYPLSLAILHK
jgi:hypothetical protein